MFGRANSVYNYSTSKILVRYGLTTRFDAYSHRCPVMVDGPRFHIPVSGAY